LGLSERQVAVVLITISLISIPFCILILNQNIEWNQYVTFGTFAYFGIIFFTFQFLYNKGAAKKALKDLASANTKVSA
jgi:MFS-type transporter involved in bile tolerance (Atg22 family)